ncbi:MAG: hypothetical protein IJO46_15310, partial [Thermoguttaceae bacterium]|nr:hypothetical protein [Thermoguttaceae bacterium]
AKRCFDQSVKANVRKREQIELTSDAIDNLESAATLLERWEEMRLVNLAFAETAEKLFVGALIYGASEIGGLSHSSLEKFLKITNTNSRKKKERFSKTFEAQIRRKFRDGGDAQNGNPSAPFCSSAAFECWGMAPEDAPSPEMWAEIERARNQYENAELFARRQLELKEQARRDEKSAAEFNKRRQFSKSPNDRPPAEEWFGDPWGALQTEQLCFQFAELPSVEASCSRWRAAFNVAVPNENVEVCVASTAQLERGRLFWGQTTIELKRSGGYLRGILPYDNFLREARASRLRCRLDGFGFGGLSYNFGATDPTRFRELYGRSRR